jgi:hypothetical protein
MKRATAASEYLQKDNLFHERSRQMAQMAGDTSENNDMLVLSDNHGNMFAIPRDVVERHQLTPEQRAEIEKQLGEDVSGFQLHSAYMTEKLAGFHQAALLQEAEQARMARMASSDRPPSAGDQPGIQSVITGVWRSLASLRTATS